MALPISHKTVLVLDHTLSGSSGVQLDMDSFCKPRSSGGTPHQPAHYIPLRPVTKTIWTCAVEAITEYCRIVWDIFPGTRFIGLTSTGAASIDELSSWNHDQSLSAIMQILMMLGPARRGTPDLLAGCKNALHSLTQPTPLQQQQAGPLVNKGRVMVVTKLHSDQEVKLYYQKFCELVATVNRTLKEDGLPIAHVHLVLLSFNGEGEPSRVTNGSLSGGGSGVSGDVVEFQCGNSVAANLCSLVVRHYNLASTTVTGIPMKEEQNASSSANYDVELFHPAEAHAATLGDNSIRTTRQDTDYPTVTLKWSTPRTNASHELHQCSTAFRITSVDVNSRPSSCLTNFLLNGRWVMLEMPKKTPTQPNKVMSHMLAAHGGDIYIHTLLTARAVLEDPPSISEGQGGKVTDYRIPDFGHLIKANMLAPYKVNGLEESRTYLERLTKNFTITLSQSALFSLGAIVEPLARHIVNRDMDECHVAECKAVILALTGMEVKGENLNTSYARINGLKKEDQYKSLWAELEQYLRQNNVSPNHQQVLECYMQCLNKEVPLSDNESVAVIAAQPVDIELVLDEMEAEPSSRKRSAGLQDVTDTKKWRPSSSSSGVAPKKTGQSLLSLWQNKLKNIHEKGSPQFVGRLKAENNVTKLYVNLQQKDKDKDRDEGSSKRK